MSSFQIRQSAYSIALIVLLFPANLFMNASIAKFLWLHRKRREASGGTFMLSAAASNNNNEGPVKEVEKKLCFITFTMFVTNIVGLICQVSKILGKFSILKK